jgi:tetratricopeptide (TPR) repeat protein
VSFFNSLLSGGFVLLVSFLPFRPDPVLELADQLFTAGQFDEAITEYKRYLFFHAEDPENAAGYAYSQIGLSYRGQGLWGDAIAMLQKSVQAEIREDVRDERRVALGVTLIACGRYDQAEFTLLKVEMFSASESAIRKAVFFRGISALYTSKWEVARETFHNYFGGQTPEMAAIRKQIEELIGEAGNQKYKSPRLARALSTIVPGLGQIYASDLAGGFNAILIIAATGYLCVSDLVQKRILDAIFTSTFLFERFYSGNRQNAEDAAKRYNRNLSQRMTAEILKVLGSVK